MAKQSIYGLQLVIVAGRSDHGHDVIARSVLPIKDGPWALVHGNGVHSWMVTHGINTADRRHRDRHGGRLQEEPVADALGGDGTLDVNRFSQRQTQGYLYQCESGRAIEHLGNATADTSVDLYDPRSVRRELNLGVQATRRDTERLDGRRRKTQHGHLVGLAQGGWYEEASLSEVLREWKTAGHGQVADNPSRDNAFDGDVGSVGFVRS